MKKIPSLIYNTLRPQEIRWLFVFLLILSMNFYLRGQEASYLFLRNTGIHETEIIEMDVDAKGKLLLTSGRDNTAKLWDAANGDLLRTFVSFKNPDDPMPCALSPDGNLAAFGSEVLNVYNATNGQLIFVDEVFNEKILAMKFSADGNYLAVSIQNNGVNIYETVAWTQKIRIEHEDTGFSQVAFDRAGWLAVVNVNELLFFDKHFNLNRSIRFNESRRPASVAFSPDGSNIAIGFLGPHLPEVYDAGILEFLYSPQPPESVSITGNFSHVSFSHDSRYLYAAGDARIIANVDDPEQDDLEGFRSEPIIGRWSLMGRGSFRALQASGQRIVSLLVLPDGELMIANNRPELIKLSPTGHELFLNQSKANKFTDDNSEKIRVNTNADEVIIIYQDLRPLKFSLKSKTFEFFAETATRTRFRPSQKSTPNIRLARDENNRIFLNGEPMQWLEPGEEIICADIADHGLRFVLGSNHYLYCADRYGDLVWKIPLHVPVRYVNISGNARTIVAAFGDGSLRWYDMNKGQLLLNLFTYDGSKLWAVCSASGYYDAGPGAENLAGVLISSENNEINGFFPLSTFQSTHYKPELIDQLIFDWDEEKALLRNGITEKAPLIPDNKSQHQAPVED